MLFRNASDYTQCTSLVRQVHYYFRRLTKYQAEGDFLTLTRIVSPSCSMCITSIYILKCLIVSLGSEGIVACRLLSGAPCLMHCRVHGASLAVRLRSPMAAFPDCLLYHCQRVLQEPWASATLCINHHPRRQLQSFCQLSMTEDYEWRSQTRSSLKWWLTVKQYTSFSCVSLMNCFRIVILIFFFPI